MANVFRTRYEAIDTDLTRTVRATVQGGTDYEGPIVTGAEVAQLLRGDLGTNEDYPAQLAEEVLKRSLGFPVDMSQGGPAALVLSNVTGTQDSRVAQDSITVSEYSLRRRRDINAEQTGVPVPMVSPQDANTAMTSLTYPAKRPRPMPLDGIRVNPKPDPVEQALTTSLTFVQALRELGVDVHELTVALQKYWDMPCVGELLDRVAYACTGLLEQFIAQAGRPAPAMYISPNIVSLYSISSSSPVSKESVGAGNIFYTRANSIAMLNIITTNMLAGDPVVRSMTFTPNPSQYSKFTKSSLAGKAARVLTSIRPTPLSHLIRNKGSADDYVESRKSVKSLQNLRAYSLVGDVLEAEEIARPSQALPHQHRAHASTSSGMMAVSRAPDASQPRFEPAVRPHRVVSALFGMFHTLDLADRYGASFCASLAMMTLQLADTDPAKRMRRWADFCRLPGMADVLAHATPNSLVDDPQWASVLRRQNGQLQAKALMVSRVMLSDRLSVEGAVSTRQGDGWPPQPTRVHFSRWARAAISRLGVSAGHHPYADVRRSSRSLREAIGVKSVLQLQLPDMLAAHRELKDSTARLRKQKVSKASDNNMRSKVILASARMKWAEFYRIKAGHVLSILAYAVRGSCDDLVEASNLARPDTPYQHLVAGLVAEWLCNAARSLAFRFCKVAFVGATAPARADMQGKFDLPEAIERYKVWVIENTAAGTSAKLQVDLKEGLLTAPERSALKSEAEHMVAVMVEVSGVAVAPQAWVDLQAHYRFSQKLVHGAFHEVVEADRDLLVSLGLADLKFAARRPEAEPAPSPVTAQPLDVSQYMATFRPKGMVKKAKPPWVSHLSFIGEYLADADAGVSEACKDLYSSWVAGRALSEPTPDEAKMLSDVYNALLMEGEDPTLLTAGQASTFGEFYERQTVGRGAMMS